MKIIFIFMGIFLFLLHKDILNVQSAGIICSYTDTAIDENPDHKVDLKPESNTEEVRKGNKNSLNQLFHSIKCTLEKAKPWMTELQQEAKRLEEAAKILSHGILNSFSEFVDKLVDDTTDLPTNVKKNSTEATNITTDVTDEISEYLCPEGFIADHNGICERIE